MPQILVVSGYWPTKGNPISGIFVVQQVTALANLGYKVTVLLSKAIGRPLEPFLTVRELGLPEHQIELVCVGVFRLPEVLSSSVPALAINTSLSGFIYSNKIKGLTRRLGPFSGCILHGTRYAFLSLPRWRKHLSTTVVSVVHGVDPFLERISEKPGGASILKSGAMASKSVVLVGSPLKPYVIKLGVPLEKQVVIANGTDIPSLGGSKDFKDKATPKVRLISVSNLVRLKGIDCNIKALSIMAKRNPELDFEYLVIGDGPERENLERLSKELGLENRVNFMGRIGYNETMDEVFASDIFTLPSWGEAFGIVYLEAMARAKPVIGCYENGAEDIFEHGKQGFLINPKDVDGLAASLEVLISDENLRNKMGVEGRRLAENYTWENNARNILSLL
ncbi:MAG: glycosyltransferase [Marinobacter sp.]